MTAVVEKYVTGYDRFVRAMRIVSLTAAVVLALALFLWPLLDRTETSFLLSRDRLERSGQEIRIARPVFRGTDSAGRPFEVAADSALRATPDARDIRLDDMTAHLPLDDTRFADISAPRAVYDTVSKTVLISDNLRLETSDGYRLDGGRARVDLDKRMLVSAEPVSGTGPLGAFAADGLRFDLDAAHVVFPGNFRMRTVPAAATVAPSEEN